MTPDLTPTKHDIFVLVILAALVVLAITAKACGVWQLVPNDVPMRYRCHKGLHLTGHPKTALVDLMVDRACMEMSQAMGHDQAPMPTVYARVYGDGEAPTFCQDTPLGTCVRRTSPHVYEVEIRKPAPDEHRRSVEASLAHEYKHIVGMELDDGWPQTSDGQHDRMLELGVCGQDCTYWRYDWRFDDRGR